jgi:homoserine kinase
LAIGLRNLITLAETDSGLAVEIRGEGAETLPSDETNEVVRAANLVFNRVGDKPSGLKVVLTNSIPAGSGMGSSAAARLGGAIAANMLLGEPLSRDDVLRIAVDIEGHPDNICAAMLGGLVISSLVDESLIYRRVAVARMSVAVVVPSVQVLTEELRSLLPKQVTLIDAASNIGRAALVVQALAEGDFDLLSEAMRDRLHEPYRSKVIPGYDQVVAAAYGAGASAVAISGAGPALIAFGPHGLADIAKAMAQSFEAATGKSVRQYTLPVESQGVMASAG